MKKKILEIGIIAILIALLIVLTGCGNNETTQELSNNTEDNQYGLIEKKNLEDIYLEVLKNERNFINENNVTSNIKEFSDLNKLDGYEEKVIYAIVDLDQDEKEELVSLVNNLKYLILNYEEDNDTVYGFEVTYRGLEQLKTNGYYMASGGAGLSILCKCTFNKNVRSEETLTEMDVGIESTKYVIEGSDVTENQYNNYMQENFYSKDDVKWINLETGNIIEDTEETITNSSTETFEDGTYTYTYPNSGLEMEGTKETKETLTFNNGTVTYKMDYFDDEKTGTYTINNDKITVTYTKEKLWNQGDDCYTTEAISETVIYTLDNSTLKITEKGLDKIYKK